MRKLLFILLALCLSSPVFAVTTITDSLTVIADGSEPIGTAGAWVDYVSFAPYEFVNAGYTTTTHCANFRFNFTTPVPSNATFTSVSFRWFNCNVGNSKNWFFKIGIANEASATAITDSASFGAQYRNQLTTKYLWHRTGTRDSTFYATTSTDSMATLFNSFVAAQGGIADYIQLFVDDDGSNAYVRACALEEATPVMQRPAKIFYTYTVPDAATEGNGRLRQDISGGRKW